MRRNEGFLLITVLLLVLAVSILVLTTAFTSIIDRTASANQRGATDAYYVATAGLNKYKTVAFQTYRYYLANMDDYEDAIRAGNPACGNFLNIGLDLDRDKALKSVRNGGVDLLDGDTVTGSEGNGTYEVKFEVAGRYAVLTSTGRAGRNSRSTVQLVLEPQNAGLLNHAIFAGGQSSTFLNGNVEVYGGIHLVGDPADPYKYVIDTNGNFRQYNYYGYQELESVVKDSRITGANLKTFLGLNHMEQRDLCAHLRVKNGHVRVSGSAALGGEPSSLPARSGYKTNLEGVHLSGGALSLDQGTIDRIHADELGEYDLSSDLPLPTLDDPRLDLVDDCEAAGTWRECLHGPATYVFREADLTTCKTQGGEITEPGTLISNGTLTFDTTPIECMSADRLSGFEYKQENGRFTLSVYGLTNFQGLDLHFSQNVVVRFDSQATLFVEGLDAAGRNFSAANRPDFETMQGGDVTIAGDLLPAESFPDKDVLGIIADGVIRMTGDNQQDSESPKEQVAMGMFYAGQRAEIVKGGIVFGTVIAPEFTFTSGNAGQTSTIVQVPGLSYGSAPGFAFVEDSYKPTFRVVSYERR